MLGKLAAYLMVADARKEGDVRYLTVMHHEQLEFGDGHQRTESKVDGWTKAGTNVKVIQDEQSSKIVAVMFNQENHAERALVRILLSTQAKGSLWREWKTTHVPIINIRNKKQ